MKLRPYLLSLLLFIPLSSYANSNDNSDLLVSCQSLNTDKKSNPLPCHYFIQGFLSSALAIDSSLHEKQSKKKYQHYRTKGRTLPAKFIYFCIPQSKSDSDVIMQMAKQIPENINDIKVLRDSIFNLLQTQYPCSKMGEN